ncbi:MAG TPA: hypothetical protein VN764_08485, partial [Polyangiaceae bacterium]|nr:hypothetical protein [Polyangiaceae bacterium]
QLQTFDNNGRLVPDGTPQIATIQSIYAGSQVSLQSAAAGAQGEARAEDRAVDPILERSGELVRLHPGIFMALQALSNINWTRMSAAIGGIPNMSATAAADLQPIWGKASSLGASADLSADLTSGERRSINVLNRFASHVAAALRNPNPTG